MGSIKRFVAYPKPSLLMRRMVKHKGDVSEGSTRIPVATRYVLGRKVVFYHDGWRFIEQVKITEEEMFESEILRFAHASLLTGEPVGDKRLCCVDATANPVKVWLFGTTLEDFIKQSSKLVATGAVDPDFLLGTPLDRIKELKDERNVRLFGNELAGSHF